MSWFLKCLRNYLTFSGRARRKEYWMFTLFGTIFGIVFAIIDGVLDSYPLFSFFFGLAILLPSIAVAVRRLHDTGKSGAWYLISLIPFVGGIVLLVFTCMDSDPGRNRYGANPKGVEFDGERY